jgi:tetratricopeptide (TPR) repeat protein/transcriptional regulator with XRE-family HTH domain
MRGSTDRTQFGQLLLRHRLDANLTQQALAMRAHVTVQAIGMLERGTRRAPRHDTVVRLARALSLSPAHMEALLVASRAGSRSEAPPPPAPRALPRDVATFTGREADLEQLLAAVSDMTRSGGAVAICAIDGMAGVGKTAFAIHAAHRLAHQYPDGQVFLDLRAHAAGLQPLDPFDALGTLLLTVGVGAQALPPDLDARVSLWRDHLAARRMLIVLDDAAGNDQVRSLLPGAAGCLVLITSRRRLAALEDARPLTLGTLPPADAAALLARLAEPGRAAEWAAVADLVELAGRLPLAIGLLAGRLRSHPAWTVRHLAALLRASGDRLAELRAENVAVEAAFELSYRDLPADLRRLFARLGAHPGREIDAHAAAALDGVEPAEAGRRLERLYDEHLVDEPAPGRYRLHDLLRAYARSLAGEDGEDAADRLLEHYLRALARANRHIARRDPRDVPPAAGTLDLSTWNDALAWLEAERANLVACFDHAAASGRDRAVVELARGLHAFLDMSGPWDRARSMQRTALEAARRGGDRLAEADALTDLGDVQRRTGEYGAAQASLCEALALFRELGSQPGEAAALTDLGDVQRTVGDYAAAADSLTAALALHRRLGSRLGEARSLNCLAIVRSLTGDRAAAMEAVTEALAISRDSGYGMVQVNALNNLGCMQYMNDDYAAAAATLTEALLLSRRLGIRLGHANALVNLGHVQHLTGDYAAASRSLTEARTLFRDLGNRAGEASLLHELGTAQRAMGDHAAASESLTASLAIFRGIASRDGQADALRDLGIVRRLTGDAAAAVAALEEALALFCGLGNRLGQAQVVRELGMVRLDAGDVAGAMARHREALQLAGEAGSPLERARAEEGLGRCLLRVPDRAGAIDRLREALVTYERLGVPDAGRVRAELAGLRA